MEVFWSEENVNLATALVRLVMMLTLNIALLVLMTKSYPVVHVSTLQLFVTRLAWIAMDLIHGNALIAQIT
jgi:hypothetical protein